jgi:hypothetical protein
MKRQFDKGVRATPDWNIGDKVWLSSRQIATTRPSAKLDHRWLGPFPIIDKISKSAYKLTLPASMKGVHPLFHVSVLRKRAVDLIEGRWQEDPGPVIVNGEEEWEVEEILDCRRKGKRLKYLVSWKGFG